ncbi:D-Ala-D-Ala carboxypeptidase family metallohydrolase [Aureimonas sp. AU4]|uniref:D-Ala-D-Ala carboxypeptidase family metallohydrolase n=1 Tax=Aureimonas sp. AU4 TaxID=1638163 RepID=UPI0007806CF9|nr:D-Ala-D-Ala carboxypeptidase family metallohydrolase [Aureimonas sp. AU4]
MSDANATSRAVSSRRLLTSVLAVSSCILFGGCVSAVDESASFGFSPQNAPGPSAAKGDQVAALIDADASKPGKPEGDPEAAKPADRSPTTSEQADKGARVAAAAQSTIAERIAAGGEAARSDKSRAEVAALAEGHEGGIAPTSLLQRTSNPAVAAYAERDASGRQADRSLYASLYNESTARTPIRNTDAQKSRRVVVIQTDGIDKKPGDNNLPGVDPKSLFEIGQRASADSDLLDDIGGSYQIASLSGIARLAPSGLLIQREDIVTNCFQSDLLALISQIEQRFKQKVVITSGYRSPSHNRRVNGAKASMHMACKAADLHVPGVNGVTVAAFVRSLPGRGGVGTYCHTAAIHIDVGPTRDWNWACRQRREG